MTTKNTPPAKAPTETEPVREEKHEETPFEAAASICSVLVVGLFILTFLAQNFVIPSGSMGSAGPRACWSWWRTTWRIDAPHP